MGSGGDQLDRGIAWHGVLIVGTVGVGIRTQEQDSGPGVPVDRGHQVAVHPGGDLGVEQHHGDVERLAPQPCPDLFGVEGERRDQTDLLHCLGQRPHGGRVSQGQQRGGGGG
jgi:hypothetical protein